jgi:uncharacterized membrane protein
MPIEFRCTHCDRLLRVPDGTEGKDAKCPQCGTIVIIPHRQPPPAPASPTPPVPPPFRETVALGDTPNPYQSPQAMGLATPQVQHGFQPTLIDFADVFSRTWEIYKRNLGACIAGTLVIFACSAVVNVIAAVIYAAIESNMQGGALVAMWFLEQLINQAIGAFFWIGLILFLLNIARTETADFGLLFAGGPFFLFGAAVQIITTIAIMLGFVLLIVPGVILALMFSQSMYMIVDQRADIMGALRMSMEATRGNKLTLLALYIVAGFGALLFTLLTCFIGAIFVWPFMALMTVVVYLGLTGQQTALDRLPQPPLAERPFAAPGAQPTT